MRAERIAVLLVVILGMQGCIASNVVAPEDRIVVQPVDGLVWSQGESLDLADGRMYESVRITGQAAGQLAKIYYLFGPDGRYTAAALLREGDGARFQTIDGTWQFDGRTLTLDEGSAADLQVAEGGYVQLATELGAVVLRAVDIE